MTSKTFEKDKRKVKKLVECQSFDLLILNLIFLDAIALGLMTYFDKNSLIGRELFVLDRLFMAIFIVEMLMKLYAFGTKFFKNGWNTFDLIVIGISSVSFFGYFIIFRAFRLFRLLKYVDKFGRLRKMINVFIMLLPNFLAMLLVLCIFFYVFAIMGVWLYGKFFIEFSNLGESALTLLRVFTLDGWYSSIAKPVMVLFPNSWIFFISFLFTSLLVVVSFLMSVVAEIVNKRFEAKDRL